MDLLTIEIVNRIRARGRTERERANCMQRYVNSCTRLATALDDLANSIEAGVPPVSTTLVLDALGNKQEAALVTLTSAIEAALKAPQPISRAEASGVNGEGFR